MTSGDNFEKVNVDNRNSSRNRGRLLWFAAAAVFLIATVGLRIYLTWITATGYTYGALAGGKAVYDIVAKTPEGLQFHDVSVAATNAIADDIRRVIKVLGRR